MIVVYGLEQLVVTIERWKGSDYLLRTMSDDGLVAIFTGPYFESDFLDYCMVLDIGPSRYALLQWLTDITIPLALQG